MQQQVANEVFDEAHILVKPHFMAMAPAAPVMA
jgi:hypothetical protein